MPNGNQGAIAGLLGGIAETMPAWGKGLATRREREGMSDLAKLQKMANPRDIADIEALAELLPQLTAADREKAIEKVRKRIGTESIPLLEYYIRRGGEAPPPGIETWRIGGAPAGAAARTRLERLRMGTEPGFEPELALPQLPEETRMAEWVKRAGRAEPIFPGITEVGRGMMPRGVEEVLPPTEATRQRAREAGAWPGITAITGEWTPQMLAEEKEETIRIAEAKGLLDKYGVAAAKTFIDKEKLPRWLEMIPESLHPRVGVKAGTSNLSENPVEAASELNLRSILSQPKPTLAEIQGMPNLDRMRVAVFGEEMLSPAEITAIKEERSTLPSWLIKFVDDPLVGKAVWADDWFDTIKKLLRYFSPQEIAAMLSMAHDRAIREGLAAEVGFAEGVR
ncbi:hypothetical protein ES702_03074 [subsurface metagenome]